MRRVFFLILVPLAASAAPTSLAAVRSALDTSRAEPLTADGWRFLGDDVDLRLAETAKDARIPLPTRVRAVWALGVIGSEPAHRFLSHVLATEDVESPLLAASVEAFALAFKSSRLQEATRVAIEHLRHPESNVRSAAARALGRIGSDAAKKALAERRAEERDAAVAAEISFALKATVAGR